MQHKLYRDRFTFWKDVSDYAETLDLNRTLQLPFGWFQDNDVEHRCGTFQETVSKLNELYGERYSVRDCYVQRPNIFVMYKQESDKEVKVVLKKEEVKVELPTQERQKEKEEVSFTEEKVIKSQEIKVDWEWVDSLKNTAPAKKELGSYAKPFGINLRRNQTIDNMRKELREFLNV